MKVLLHVCCGPCSIFPSIKLSGLKIPFDAFFYNPNIENKEEYEKRLLNAKKVSKLYNFTLIENKEEVPIIPKELKTNNRCGNCYLKRFDVVFKYAKEHNYTHVTSTLLGSPYQNRELLLKRLDEMSKKYKIDYLDINFKEGFYYGQGLARKNDIYCQKFCGCQISYLEYLKKEKEREND